MDKDQQELIKEVVDKANKLQHFTTKHMILNYLLLNEIIDVHDEVYKDILKMDETGVLKIQY